MPRSPATATALLLLSAPLALADTFAVLVAGSKGYENYRHQADIAHAYTLLTAGGVLASNIVMMMYDDIAEDHKNKFKGQVFNRPGDDAPDVYAAVKGHIDYRSKDVNPDTFLKVITGDKSGTGRVLESGPDDEVFIYFADHGGVGALAFAPHGLSPGMKLLHADKINAALQTMHQKQMYKRLTFYVEACESGSIFDGLLNASLGVYAVTAANPHESSWGWYCGSNATVRGKNIGSCLGDEFSVRWMEDSDAADEKKETLAQQFTTLVGAVTKSHVQKYGDDEFSSLPLADFMGDEPPTPVAAPARRSGAPAPVAAVDSRDARLHYLRWRLGELRGAAEATTEEVAEAEAELAAEEKSRADATKLFGAVWSQMTGESAPRALERYTAPRDFACHNEVVESARLAYTDFSLKYHRVVVNLCEMGFDAKRIVRAFAAAAAPALAEEA